MNTRTHAYLGEVLYPVIRETWGIDLSRKRFIAGSIKPDVCTLFVTHPHFWRHSRSYALKKIKKLSGKILAPGKKHKKFSENLGILLHYIADFFTAVHNLRPNPLGEHFAYEELLDREFKKYVTLESARTTMLLICPPGSSLGLDPASLLDDLHERYAPSREDPLADIREILVACVSVTAYIMDFVREGSYTVLHEDLRRAVL
jgi:hypothetical protein